MKKVLLLSAFAIFGLSISSSAQKQIGGDKNFEVNIAPLGGNPVQINGIKFRYFTSEEIAIRVELFLGGTNDQTVNTQAGAIDADNPALYDIDKSFTFSIRPGIEKHLDGTRNMSPYFGAFLDFTTSSMRFTNERWGMNPDDAADFQVASKTTIDGSTSFGLNAVAGMDYYFTDNFYLGLELGFGWMNTNQKDTTVDYDLIEFYEGAGAEPADPLENGKSSAWGPNVNALFRLGYLIN